MAVNPDAALSRGDLMRQNRDLKTEIRETQTGRRLESSSIGKGGVTVKGGAIVILDDQGAEILRLSTNGITLDGDINVTGGGRVIVEAGGGFVARDGADISAQYPNGTDAVRWGELLVAGTDVGNGHGIIVQEPGTGGQPDIFRAVRRPDGETLVLVGSVDPDTLATQFVDRFVVSAHTVTLESDDQINLNSEDLVHLRSDTFNVRTAYLNTGSAANCFLDVDGRIHRDTSARRFKTDIEDVEVDPAVVLRMRPRTWRNKPHGGGSDGLVELPESEADDTRYVGFIAEELDELGLSMFVTRDRDGQPDGIQYDRLSVALLSVVKDLEARVSALEGGA